VEQASGPVPDTPQLTGYQEEFANEYKITHTIADKQQFVIHLPREAIRHCFSWIISINLKNIPAFPF
jgi:hypothetical protein